MPIPTPDEFFNKTHLYESFAYRGREVFDVAKLIFEKHGFLPGNLLVKRVLYLLRRRGYAKTEKYQGKKAYSTTESGIVELEKIKEFCQELSRSI